MSTDRRPTSIRTAARWILTPLIAFIAFVAWGFASPVGAGPDDDFHLASIWCANGGSIYCEPGSEWDTRVVSVGFKKPFCFVAQAEESAACQVGSWPKPGGETFETDRGNFYGEYPPVYYATMRLLAGPDVEVSAMTMRILNAALVVGLATALAALLPVARRRTLLWGWLVALVPLGMFIIPSNNPSGWALMGIGTAYLALLGWFETVGRRRWALGALYLVGVLMAAGARGDAAVYVIGATGIVMLLTIAKERSWLLGAILPAMGLIIAGVFFATSGQAVLATPDASGGSELSLSGQGVGLVDGSAGDDPVGRPTGFALAAYNLLMLPFVWTGVWGTWGLGWLDTMMPAVVPWAAAAAFIVVAFAGLGLMTWRKAISVAGVLAVLVVLPVYVLTVDHYMVGEHLQPRYLLPLITLLAFVLVTEPGGRLLRFTRIQTFAILGALVIANTIALHMNIRRYVTGADQQGPNLDAGAEWWWDGFVTGPSGLWIIGSLAFAGMLVLLWPELRRTDEVLQTVR